MFENIETNTNIRLTKSGINKDSVNKYFRICDDEICKDSNFINNFITDLESINNNGKLEARNMTEEKFNELFPLVDRFSTIQGKNDCYLITTLTSLYKNPITRGTYYKCFEQKGDDIYVSIPAYKGYKGTVVFPKGEIELGENSADAPKHIQMLERT